MADVSSASWQYLHRSGAPFWPRNGNPETRHHQISLDHYPNNIKPDLNGRTTPDHTSSKAPSSQSRASGTTTQPQSAEIPAIDAERPIKLSLQEDPKPHVPSGHGAQSIMQASTHVEPNDVFKISQAHQALSRQASELRSQIMRRHEQLQILERMEDEQQQAVLKSLRNLLAGLDTRTGDTLIGHKLLSDTTRILSRERDDRGPLIDDIQHLERKLDVVNYKLQKADEDLHRKYYITQPSQEGHAANSESFISDNENLASETTNPLSRMAKLDRSDDEMQEASELKPQKLKIYRPSEYHPKYAYWQQRLGELKLLEERIWDQKYREDKLHNRKAGREIVELHLAKEDEEELERLPSAMAKLATELEEVREEVERLKQECLLLGIIDEDGEPVEALAGDSNGKLAKPQDTRARQSSRENNSAFEAWVIIPTRTNNSRRRFSRSRWANSNEVQKNLSEQDIVRSIAKLDRGNRGSLVERRKKLTPDQNRRVDHVCAERNKREPDALNPWAVVQIAWSQEAIGSQQGRSKVYRYSIMVFLQKKARPARERPRPASSANYGYERNSTRSSPRSRKDSMTTVTSGRETSEECLAERSRRVAESNQRTHAEHHRQYTSFTDAGGDQFRSVSDSDMSLMGSKDEGPAYGGLQSRIEPWMFQMLRESRTEVRLLATIMQVMGIPLLEETAALVVQYWSLDVRLTKLHFNMHTAMLAIKLAGYDIALWRQVASVAALPFRPSDMGVEDDCSTQRNYSEAQWCTRSGKRQRAQSETAEHRGKIKWRCRMTLASGGGEANTELEREYISVPGE